MDFWMQEAGVADPLSCLPLAARRRARERIGDGADVAVTRPLRIATGSLTRLTAIKMIIL